MPHARGGQEQDMVTQLLRQWVEAGQRPPWEEVTGSSTATKGMWTMFEALRVKDGVLQRAWKEPATGEERWQVIVPSSLRDCAESIPWDRRSGALRSS